MRTPLFRLLLRFTTAFFVLIALSCSSEDTDPTPDPDIGSTPDPNPNPNPNPDPDPVSQNDIALVDDAVAAFMQKYDVPGAAIAVSVNEKMVYTKGYGFSNTTNSTATKTDDVFRLASITKVFTSTAIWKLIDENQLSLDDKVFGPTGILGDDFGTASLTADELNITIDHLLMNEAGGWAASSGGDPIDYQPQLNSDDFIEYVLNNWDLSHAPGESYHYSNTGYWLLARIIEKVSGQSYEDYIANLISSTGITSFKVTTYRQEDREPNEVEYYGTEADSPYIYTIASRRDGDGGGVISAPDLLRFLSAIDGFSNRQDIISPSAINLRKQVSEHQPNFGKGIGIWQSENLLFFTGSFPGTRTWFMIGENGKSAVILLNYRRTDVVDFDFELQDLLLEMIKNNSLPWQTDLDQF
ncbi:serine hydrolase domain-containing protein [Flagellimonas nanhaiensis]|uniref:Class A beta-lactamase-related serine hydrolase n=1 Tax=Flagellimonas nanhaiensis TaxID=2292706 RepID=A0A371JRQ0_9FLAO|nr:serine hydrolase domain-containing protein [Allomuricauda nanhaiensis]RDY60167.1 class A beta-lactamase-related serine hydrolase [Allomuricauda nanhaiensis]